MVTKLISQRIIIILIGCITVACIDPNTLNRGSTPSAPQDLNVIAGDGQVVFSWKPPASDGDSAIIRYEVSNGGTWQNVDNNLTYTFTGLTNNVLYTFKVRAINANGNGAESIITATPTIIVYSCECNDPCIISGCECSDCPGQSILIIPIAGDFSAINLTQIAGSVTAVSVTANSGKTTGIITVLYGDSKSVVIPQTAGVYKLFVNVTAAGNYNLVTELELTQQLIVNLITFANNDFIVTGETIQTEGEVTEVLVTWERTEIINVSYRGINDTVYSKKSAIPQIAGFFEVIIDIAAVPGFFAAVIERRVFTFEVKAKQIDVADITFNIDMNQITNLADDIISNVIVYKIASTGKTNTAVFSLPGSLSDYNSIEWFVNGDLQLLYINNLSFSINAADYAIGTRSVTVILNIDDMIYNKTVYFNVFMF